ncbi:hypothetical protein BJ138DRAFT_233502 [Hygrophoropsis aurantiaca]|uniref:Uncharacterized protein n=1 Tax=Hygrophoropsis aurantiaca TaxID=72124 RepID=A0ACB8A9J9_9AGAM|nr:hypothetical protein BJ138DRAFT_233502 [Hygrophoropsis aurantiaca]
MAHQTSPYSTQNISPFDGAFGAAGAGPIQHNYHPTGVADVGDVTGHLPHTELYVPTNDYPTSSAGSAGIPYDAGHHPQTNVYSPSLIVHSPSQTYYIPRDVRLRDAILNYNRTEFRILQSFCGVESMVTPCEPYYPCLLQTAHGGSCDQYVKGDRNFLRNHIKHEHGVSMDSTVPISCIWPHCSTQIQATNMGRHMLTHHLGIRWTCSGCLAVLGRSDVLRTMDHGAGCLQPGSIAITGPGALWP